LLFVKHVLVHARFLQTMWSRSSFRKNAPNHAITLRRKGDGGQRVGLEALR
jgi:hypothetical protein